MRRYVPRALLTAAVAVSASACATGMSLDEFNPSASGRYYVLVPDLAVQGGASADIGADVSDQLREMIAGMATHTSVPDGVLEDAMDRYEVQELNEVTARQMAQQINVQNVLWGEIQQGGAGLEADVTFVDVASGDQIPLENVSGATADELAQAIYGQLGQAVEGVRQAAFCNDYLSSQQFDRALTTCEQALAIVPNSTAALYGQATALLNLERPQEALDTYQQLLEIDPAHQDALLGAGLAASQVGQSDLATGFYNRYLEVNPGNVQVRMTVANDIAQTGDYVSAYRVLESVIDDNADNVDFQQYLFSIATAAGQDVQTEQGVEAARPFFETALQAYNTAFTGGGAELNASTLRQAIAVNNALGQTQEAIALAREATTQFDTVASIWSQYATVLNDAGQSAEAAEALTRVIELDPDYQNAYVRRAMAYLDAGQTQQARSDLQQAAERGDRENVARVLFSMGATAVKENNFSEAADQLALAHQYAEGDLRSDVSFFWGYSLYRQGEAIAKANTQGSAAEARRALALFQEALPLLQNSAHADAAQVADAAQQYIANQEAIIQAAG